MLIGKTEILYGYYRYVEYPYFTRCLGFEGDNEFVCGEWVYKLFNLPRIVKRLQFFAYNKPSKNRLELKIYRGIVSFDGEDENFYYFVRGNKRIYFDAFIEIKLEKLYENGYKTIYVECEYE